MTSTDKTWYLTQKIQFTCHLLFASINHACQENIITIPTKFHSKNSWASNNKTTFPYFIFSLVNDLVFLYPFPLLTLFFQKTVISMNHSTLRRYNFVQTTNQAVKNTNPSLKWFISFPLCSKTITNANKHKRTQVLCLRGVLTIIII